MTVGSVLGFEAEHEVATTARDTYIHGLLIVFSSRRGVYRRWCGLIEASSPRRSVFLHAFMLLLSVFVLVTLRLARFLRAARTPAVLPQSACFPVRFSKPKIFVLLPYLCPRLR